MVGERMGEEGREREQIAPTLRPQSASASRQQQQPQNVRGMRPGSARERRIVGRVNVVTETTPVAGVRSAGSKPLPDTRATSVGKRMGAEKTDTVPSWQVSADMPAALGGVEQGTLGGDQVVFNEEAMDAKPARYKMSKDYPRFMSSVKYPDPRTTEPKPVRERVSRPTSEDAPHYMGGLAEGVNAYRGDRPQGFGIERVKFQGTKEAQEGKSRSYSCSYHAPEWMNKVQHDDIPDEWVRTADPETEHKHAGGSRQTGSDGSRLGLKDAPRGEVVTPATVGKAKARADTGLAVQGVAAAIQSELKESEAMGDAFTRPGGVHNGGRKRFHVRSRTSKQVPSYARQTITSVRRGPLELKTDLALMSLTDKALQAKSQRGFFNSFNVTGGTISQEAFEEGLRRHGVRMTHNGRNNFDKEIAERLFERLDPRGEGSISFHDFNAAVQPAGDRRHPDRPFADNLRVRPHSAVDRAGNRDSSTAASGESSRPSSPHTDKNLRGVSGIARLRKELKQRLYNRHKETWVAYCNFNTQWDNGLDVGEFAHGLHTLNIPVQSEQEVKDLFEDIADLKDENGKGHTMTFSCFRKHFAVNDGEGGEALFGPDHFVKDGKESGVKGELDVDKAKSVLKEYNENCGQWAGARRGAESHPLNLSMRAGEYDTFLGILRDRMDKKVGEGQTAKKFAMFQRSAPVPGAGGSTGVVSRDDFKSGLRSLDMPLPSDEVITALMRSCHEMPAWQATRQGVLPDVSITFRQFHRLVSRPDRPLVNGVEHSSIENADYTQNQVKGSHVVKRLEPRLVYGRDFTPGMAGIDQSNRRGMSSSRIFTRARSARA